MPMTLQDVPLPQITETLANTQPKIRSNFQIIDRAFLVDHQAYATADEGKHKKVTFLQQAADPVPPAGATEYIMYNKVVAGSPQMFLQFPNGAATFNFTQRVAGLNGYLILPNGIMMKWGEMTVNGADTQAFPGGAIPAFSAAPFQVLLSITQTTNNLTAQQVVWNRNLTNATNLAVVCTNGAGVAASVTFSYLAFGFSV